MTIGVTGLLRRRILVVGSTMTGTLMWKRQWGDKALMRYEATLREEDGSLRLVYATREGASSEQQVHDCTILLEATPQPFGGRRWWFLCPITGKRVMKLHMPAGELAFASREACRLAYAIQRISPRDRATQRAFRLRRRIGDHGGVGDPIQKPKWMRRATYAREMDRIWDADEVCDMYLAGAVDRIMRRVANRRAIEGAS